MGLSVCSLILDFKWKGMTQPPVIGCEWKAVWSHTYMSPVCSYFRRFNHIKMRSSPGSSILKALWWTSQSRSGRAGKKKKKKRGRSPAAYFLTGAQPEPWSGHITPRSVGIHPPHTWQAPSTGQRVAQTPVTRARMKVIIQCGAPLPGRCKPAKNPETRAGLDSPCWLRVVDLPVWRCVGVNTASEDRQSRSGDRRSCCCCCCCGCRPEERGLTTRGRCCLYTSTPLSGVPGCACLCLFVSSLYITPRMSRD